MFLTLGIGYATTVVCTFCNQYYIVILAWSLFYLFQSFTLELPWATCGNEWNTDQCVESKKEVSLQPKKSCVFFMFFYVKFWLTGGFFCIGIFLWLLRIFLSFILQFHIKIQNNQCIYNMDKTLK